MTVSSIPPASLPLDDSCPLRSLHTHSFWQILDQLGLSLIISTYQAGKVIVVRADGETLNTHFRQFHKPMGLAVTPDRLAIGTGTTIWELRNNTTVAKRIEPTGMHDACFIPRYIHFTGDIDVHEMAWVGDELWFLNTKFSCLCTRDENYSFVPQWRPPFITAYDLRDRCHLNGLGLREGQPRYVTALGVSDTPGGWRQNKSSGGILMDIDTDEILLNGLSMPHSPRWHRNQLWVLESGKGSLGYLDESSHTIVTVAQVPGFTRGLDFYDNLAFIGLSQVRESAVFSGLPLTQSLTERNCGVWVVNIETGETLAYLKFEAAVQEIFSVAILKTSRFPEILNEFPDLLGESYVMPPETLAETVMPPADWEYPEQYFREGNGLYAQGKLIEAIAAYRRCLALQETFLPARYNLAITLGDLEQYEEAELELKTVIASEARHADAYNSLGLIYSKQNKLDAAVNCYKQALDIYPNFPKALQNLGAILLLQDKTNAQESSMSD